MGNGTGVIAAEIWLGRLILATVVLLPLMWATGAALTIEQHETGPPPECLSAPTTPEAVAGTQKQYSAPIVSRGSRQDTARMPGQPALGERSTAAQEPPVPGMGMDMRAVITAPAGARKSAPAGHFGPQETCDANR